MNTSSLTYVASAPSNIALLKYWGKRDAKLQWPANDSLSMTLRHCRTTTTAAASENSQHSFAFADADGRVVESGPQTRALDFVNFLQDQLGRHRPLRILTQNTFPSSCGIASSASGMAALTVAVAAATLDAADCAALNRHGWSMERLAAMARLGSGSACRSLFGGFVHWHAGADGHSQSTRTIFGAEHWQLNDTVVIVSEAKKLRSSSSAHEDAWSSPLFSTRLAGIDDKRSAMERAIAERRLDILGPLIEQEALEMHSVMMTAKPPAYYLTDATTEFLVWLRHWRQATGGHAYFTIDAGPNVHVICEPKTTPILKLALATKFPSMRVIDDEIGDGVALHTKNEGA